MFFSIFIDLVQCAIYMRDVFRKNAKIYISSHATRRFNTIFGILYSDKRQDNIRHR